MDHPLQLNPSQTEVLLIVIVLVIPAKQSLIHHINIQISPSSLSPVKAAINLGVRIYDQLQTTDCSSLLVMLLCSLSNSKNLTYLPQYATHLLVQAIVISHLDYCNSPLADFPSSEPYRRCRMQQHAMSSASKKGHM